MYAKSDSLSFQDTENTSSGSYISPTSQAVFACHALFFNVPKSSICLKMSDKTIAVRPVEVEKIILIMSGSDGMNIL